MLTHEYIVRVFPLQHELAIRLTLHGVDGSLLLQTPTWVPGAYGLMKYGRDLVEVEARDATGRSLVLHREGWSGFRLEEATGTVNVTFRAYAYDPAWGELSGLVGHENAVLLATRYLYAPALPGSIQVAYDLPPEWSVHHPSGAKRLPNGRFEYPSFAALLDAPVVCGQFERHTRMVEGTAFHHLFLDRTVGFDSEVERFVDSLVKVAAEAKRIFGSFPFEDYTYIFTFNPTAHWGLEHANSTMIGLGEHALIDPEVRARAVRVCAHELFHAWNVCRLKPEALAKPDHAVAPVIDSLWVAEGVTRYYEFLLSVRAGEITPEQFFSNLVNYHRHLAAMPAFGRVSPLDSSRTTFLNHNKYPGSINTTLDYYDLGMLIAFDLDAHLRLECASSLDAEFRAFYDRFAGNPEGYTHTELLGTLGSRPGAAELMRNEVERRGTLSTLARLTALGFQVGTEEVSYLGLVLKENLAAELVNVLDDAPAAQTGIAPGDELLRVGGYPFSLKALRWLVARGGPIAMQVRRGHLEHTFTATPAKRKQVASLIWRGSAEQLGRWRGWLQRPDLQLADGQAVSLASFENFHGIQTVL